MLPFLVINLQVSLQLKLVRNRKLAKTSFHYVPFKVIQHKNQAMRRSNSSFGHLYNETYSLHAKAIKPSLKFNKARHQNIIVLL